MTTPEHCKCYAPWMAAFVRANIAALQNGLIVCTGCFEHGVQKSIEKDGGGIPTYGIGFVCSENVANSHLLAVAFCKKCARSHGRVREPYVGDCRPLKFCCIFNKTFFDQSSAYRQSTFARITAETSSFAGDAVCGNPACGAHENLHSGPLLVRAEPAAGEGEHLYCRRRCLDEHRAILAAASGGVLCSYPPCCAVEPAEREQRFKACGKCHTARYCTRDCQAAHWTASHRAECKVK